MITDYVKAGYPALLVRTHEQERFISSTLPQLTGRTAYTWDLVRGYRELGNGAEWQEADPFDLPKLAAHGKEKAVWFLRNYHFHLKDPVVIQALQNNFPIYKTKGISLVILAPDADLPIDLEREVVVLDFPLPTRDELRSILAGLEESTEIKAENEDAVLDAAQGLPWGDGCEDRERPTLEEIQTLRKYREALADIAKVSLCWLATDEYEERPWSESETGLAVDINAPDGNVVNRVIPWGELPE
jgi:hypothetical protein